MTLRLLQIVLAATLLLILPDRAHSQEILVTIDEKTHSLNVDKLRDNEKSISTVSPSYKVKKTFIGIPLTKVLERSGFRSAHKKEHTLVVTCEDGFRPLLKIEDIMKARPLLAYREAASTLSKPHSSDGLWTLLKKRNNYTSPGPFYLVWDSSSKFADAFSWAYKIKSLKLVPNAKLQEYTKLAPPGNFDKRTQLGYHMFLKKCFACHSIHGVGPKTKGPDLAMVTKYMSKTKIQKVIRGGRGEMPSLSDSLSDRNIQTVIKYLEAISSKSFKDKSKNP